MPGAIRGRLLDPPTLPEGEPITIEEAVTYAEGHTQHNRAVVEEDRLCGCAHCLNFFPGRTVRSWVNVEEDPANWNDDTAACPICGHNAVLASVDRWPMSVPFFLALHDYIYPEEGYCDPRMIIFTDSYEEAAYMEQEREDWELRQLHQAARPEPCQRRVHRVRPVKRQPTPAHSAAPAQGNPYIMNFEEMTEDDFCFEEVSTDE